MVYQGCALRPRHSPQPSPIQRMAARLPARIVFMLHGRNDFVGAKADLQTQRLIPDSNVKACQPI